MTAVPAERLDQWVRGYEIEEYDGGVRFEFWYPNPNKAVRELTIGLMDVRAADSITIHYDFTRDGWVVTQDLVQFVPGGAEVVAEDQEVAFIPAWNEAPEEVAR